MGEREAWLWLAEIWETRTNTGAFSRTYVEVAGMRCTGLCTCISSLYDDDTISWDVACRMRAKVPPSPDQCDYVWPRTLAGAKQRAAYCREMANQLSEKTA